MNQETVTTLAGYALLALVAWLVFRRNKPAPHADQYARAANEIRQLRADIAALRDDLGATHRELTRADQ